MFQIKDKDKRKYTCFVCGIQFEEYPLYQSHILEKHEEGREYIKCPLERCQAPVRDVRLHYKHAHRDQQMPEHGQMRATIWKDVKSDGTVRQKKPRFREGWYESIKMSKKLHYRSGYELSVYEILDQDQDVIGFSEEPFKIPYITDGRQHEYIPDLIVKMYNNKTLVIEIKPSNQTTLEVNKDKWRSADAACKARGWEFLVLTEVGISRLKNKVKLQNLMDGVEEN